MLDQHSRNRLNSSVDEALSPVDDGYKLLTIIQYKKTHEVYILRERKRNVYKQ